LTPVDIELLVALCRAKAGLRILPDKIYYIESRLGPVARREGVDSLEDLFDVLRAKQEDRLIWSIIEAMAGAETYFFRDRTPFQDLESRILPEAVKRRPGQPLRIFSAGCATGQETYSLAISASSPQLNLPEHSVQIIGADLSQRALEKAQKGIYSQFEVQRGLPIRRLIDHFDKQDDSWIVRPRLQQSIRWRRVNLLANLEPLGQMDVIFCRYLLVGLEPAAQRRVLENLTAILAPEGVLVLGNGESPEGLTGSLAPIPELGNCFASTVERQAA
jgi:chemotaxis protein methyltransferase CheR